VTGARTGNAKKNEIQLRGSQGNIRCETGFVEWPSLHIKGTQRPGVSATRRGKPNRNSREGRGDTNGKGAGLEGATEAGQHGHTKGEGPGGGDEGKSL